MSRTHGADRWFACKSLHDLRRTRIPAARPHAKSDRKLLLRGTALATTLLVGALTQAPALAQSVDCESAAPPPGGPLSMPPQTAPVVCHNFDDRTSASDVIHLQTVTTAGTFIELHNSGALTATAAGATAGINVTTAAAQSFIEIENHGQIGVTSSGDKARGINAATYGGSAIGIENSGDIAVSGHGASFGIETLVFGAHSNQVLTSITNSGDIDASSAASSATGIRRFRTSEPIRVRQQDEYRE